MSRWIGRKKGLPGPGSFAHFTQIIHYAGGIALEIRKGGHFLTYRPDNAWLFEKESDAAVQKSDYF